MPSSQTWPVNANGAILVSVDNGSTAKTADLPSNQIPKNSADKVALRFPNEVPLASLDSSGNVTGIPLSKASGFYSPMHHPIRTIACIGDSITQLNDQFGTYYGILTNINSGSNVGPVASLRGGIDSPQGNGTISYRASDKSMRWQGPGDSTPGPWVQVSDGIFTLTTPNPLGNIEVRIVARILPATDMSDTITASTTRTWRRMPGSWMYAADTLTRGRFNWLHNFGISGSGAADIANHYNDVLNSGADIIIDAVGTNDIVALTLAPSVAVAQRVANWDKALAKGIPVIAVLIAPRGGTGTVSNDTSITATLAANIVAANKGYIAEAKKRPGVYIVDNFTKTVDPTVTITKIKNYYTGDGVHPNGGLAYEQAEPIARILNMLSPDDNVNQNVGAGCYFNSTNKGGNLLPAGQGWFSGTGGTAGTGVTAGTGLAAGFTAQRLTGSAVVATANKVAATDGGPDWQGFDISGATNVYGVGVADERIMCYSGFPTIGNFAVGDVVTGSVEYEIVGSGCTGVGLAVLLTVTPGITWENLSMTTVTQGIRANGVVTLEPFVWQTGITALLPRIYMDSKAGATFTVKLRNLDLHKIVPA